MLTSWWRTKSGLWRQRGQQFVDSDWELPHADSGRVKDGVSDCGPCAADAQLSDPFDTECIGLAVEAVKEHGLNRGNIGVNRYEVAGQITVDEGARALIDYGLFQKRHPNPKCHAADHLRTRRFGIQYASGRKDSQHLPEPDLSRIRVNAYLGKMSAVGMDGVGGVVRIVEHRDGLSLGFESVGMMR